MVLEELTERLSEWLAGTGPDADIVMSCRVRLARNLADFPFIRRCTDIDRVNIESTVRERLQADERFGAFAFLNVAHLDDIDRQMLVERQLISRELAGAEGARTVAIGPLEQQCVMINEEDHLRIQVIKSGFDLAEAWRQIDALDDWIEERVDYAFDERLGYLTACPTNVGTGMRVSVMLHLPALGLAHQIERAFRGLQQINLVVRGLYGEGSQAMGDFYQVSNQITLGRSEQDLLNRVGEVVPVLIDYERKARQFLMSESQNDLFDQIRRAYGTLQNAQQISSQEALHLLSRIRLGVNLGLLDDVEIPVVNKLLINTQPAHLQKVLRKALNSNQRNVQRATYVQSFLGGNSDRSQRN